MISSISRSLILGLAVLVYSSARAQMDWTDVPDLSDSDKTDIVLLARDLGLSNPRHISVLPRLPTSDKLFVVRSEIIVDGLRRTWREIYLCRIGDMTCPALDNTSSGIWNDALQSKEQERWRFSDGDWYVDVELGAGISYAEAETIVVAIHRNEIVRMSEAAAFKYPFDASRILSIIPLDPIAREFQLRIPDSSSGSGQTLHVRLNGDEVQLLGVYISRA